MRIAFACDHAGADTRDMILDEIRRLGHEPLDFGTRGAEAVDYPDMAGKALEAFVEGKADRVVLMCGTGLGMNYVANKVPGIRCARCMDEFDARMSRAHNDSNCLALRARERDARDNLAVLRVWLQTPFDGDERHVRRIRKIEETARRLARKENVT